MTTTTPQASRARRLQIALYDRFGYGYVSRLARALGYSRQHVSRTLNGQWAPASTSPGEGDILLDKIEAWMKEQEEQAAQAA